MFRQARWVKVVTQDCQYYCLLWQTSENVFWYSAYSWMVVLDRLLSQRQICFRPLGSVFSSAACWTWERKRELLLFRVISSTLYFIYPHIIISQSPVHIDWPVFWLRSPALHMSWQGCLRRTAPGPCPAHPPVLSLCRLVHHGHSTEHGASLT